MKRRRAHGWGVICSCGWHVTATGERLAGWYVDVRRRLHRLRCKA